MDTTQELRAESARTILENEKILTVEQVSRVLQISIDAVKNLHRMEKLPGVLIGRSLRWRPADIDRFIDELGGNQ